MDSLGSGNIDVSKMSDAEKQDLQQFVVNETQKARIQQCTNMHTASLPRPFFPSLVTLQLVVPQRDIC